MEILIAYKQSKTLDKSLSYLSGVGEDLSFDISYFVRLSECSTRYFEEPIFLNYSKSIFTINKIDFGKSAPDYANDKSYADFINQSRYLPIGVEDKIVTANRYRITEIAVDEVFDFLDTKKGIFIEQSNLFAEQYRLNGIYSVKHIPIYKACYGALQKREEFSEIADKNGIPYESHQLFAYLPKPGGDIYTTEGEVSGTSIQEVYENRPAMAEKPDGRETALNKIVFASDYDKSLFYDDFEFLATQMTTIYIDKQKSVTIQQPQINLPHDADQVATADKTVLFTDYDTNYGVPEKGALAFEQEAIAVPRKSILPNPYFDGVDTQTKGLMDNDVFNVGVPKKGIHSLEHLMTGKFRSGIESFIQPTWVSQEIKGLFGEDTSIIANLSSKELNTEYTTVAIGDIAIGAHIQDTLNDRVSLDAPSLYDIDSNAFLLSKYHSGLFDVETNTYVNKNNKAIDTAETLDTISKYNHDVIYAEETFIGKSNKGQFELDVTYIDKSDKYTLDSEGMNIFRSMDKGIYQEQTLSIAKNPLGLFNPDIITSVMKNPKGIYDTEYLSLNRINTKGIFYDACIGAAKGLKQTPINTEQDFVFRNLPHLLNTIDLEEMASKNNHAVVGVDTSVLFNKNLYNLTTEMTDKFFKKGHADMAINKEQDLIHKVAYDTSVIKYYDTVKKALVGVANSNSSDLVNKNYNPLELKFYGYHLSKAEYATDEVQTHLFYTIPKREYRILKESLFATKKAKATSLNQWFVNFKPAYRETTTLDLMKYFNREYYFRYEETEWAHLPTFGGIITNETIPVETKPYREIEINPNLLASKPKRDTALDRQSGFGYVEKTDYAKIKDERVDELLLPASDFNYETFAKKLIVDGNVDLRYIKRIDDEGNMYINIPVENPIHHYADLATQYIDLNVGMLIYIIEKAYNIWQSNIFVYSAMSSDGALNDILKKLKQNLFIQYPSEADQYHLHRAIRLFRWYAEMSILNNAEYMLKLRYEDIAVDYAKKDLSPLDDVAVFENLAINPSYVLVPVDNLKTSKFTIYTNRTHRVRLSFLAAVTGGNLVINDNGNIETYTEQMVTFDKELDVNEQTLTFEFTPTSPSAYFGVMKLKVANYHITSYDVEYVGKIGESNPTINHLITMLSVCGDSIDTIQKMVAHATPQTNALEQMRVYFDLHHEEKLKGKRLTIKK